MGWITVLPFALGATIVIAVRKCLLPSMREYLTSWAGGFSRDLPSISSPSGKDDQSAPGSMATLHTLQSSLLLSQTQIYIYQHERREKSFGLATHAEGGLTNRSMTPFVKRAV